MIVCCGEAVVDFLPVKTAFLGALFAHLVERQRLTKDALAALTASGLREALAFASKAAAISLSPAGADPPWLRGSR